MTPPRTLEFHRNIDGVIYRFHLEPTDTVKPRYLREDGLVWISFNPDWGWGTWSGDTTSPSSRPWDVPIDRQGNLPPEGIWVSRKADKSYVYRLVHI